MDPKDFEILAGILREPTLSKAALGRRLGLSHTAVQGRLDRLAERGVFKGFVGVPAASILGLAPRIFSWVPPLDSVLVERLVEAEGVVWAARLQPGQFAVLAYGPAEDPGVPPELSRLLRRAPDYVSVPREAAPVGPKATLGPLDWRVLEALLRDPRASVLDLSSSTGLSPKTVRKRRDRLYATGCVRLVAHLEAAPVAGLLFFHVYLGFDRKQVAEHAIKAAAGLLLVTSLDDPPGAYFFGRAGSLGELVQVEAALRALPGVREVELHVPLRFAFAAERVAGWVRAERAQWERPRSAGQR